MKVIERFSDTKVLVVGDVMLDRYWWGDVERISPEAPVPIVRLKGSSLSPGGAANVAANVVGLGSTPILVGLVGDDMEAGLLRETLEATGIDPEGLIEVTGRPTITKTRIVAHGQQVVRVDREERIAVSNESESAASAAIGKALEVCDVVILSDYGKGSLSEGILRYVISAGREAGTPVLVDPKGKDYRKYSGATMVTPNRKEAADACSLDDDIEDLVGRAGSLLLSDLDLDAVLITQSEQGMTLFEGTNSAFYIPAATHETYDVTGAGDTVIATMGVAIAAGASFSEAARLANTAAGIVVQQIGTTAINIDQLIEAVGAAERSVPTA